MIRYKTWENIDCARKNAYGIPMSSKKRVDLKIDAEPQQNECRIANFLAALKSDLMNGQYRYTLKCQFNSGEYKGVRIFVNVENHTVDAVIKMSNANAEILELIYVNSIEILNESFDEVRLEVVNNL